MIEDLRRILYTGIRLAKLLGMDLDIGRLLVLAAIARHGTMTGAAAELAYTPSAISQQVRKLESEVHVTVFVRHPRGVSLTEAHRTIVASAEDIQAQLVGLRNDLDDIAGARSGTLRLGSFHVRRLGPPEPDHPVPGAASRCRAGPQEQSDRAAARAAARARAGHRPDLRLLVNRTDYRRVVTLPLMSESTVLLLPLDHRLALRRTVRLGELADEAWIIRAEGHATRDLVARAARVAGFEALIAIEANDYPEVQAMIAAALRIALCPQLATHPLRTHVIVKPLEASVPVRRSAPHTSPHASRSPPTAPSRRPCATSWPTIAVRLGGDDLCRLCPGLGARPP